MRKEKGAIVVEATISLTAFMFAIFMILSIVNICFIQAKISVALNTAAKELSQYSYLYYALGANNLESEFNNGTEDSKQLAMDTIDGVGTMMDSLANAGASVETGDFETMMSEIETGKTTAESLITQYADGLKNDPKGFILGMGKMATNELKEEAKTALAQILARVFMEKNLKASPEDDPDAYLRNYGVVDGMDGLDFNYTTFLAYGNSNEIQLVVTYDVRVMQLLNLDFKFTIRQCSKTTAWGNGISKMNPEQNQATETGENLWDLGINPRGTKIVENEKKKYAYTDTNHGFDAYNPADNEFVTIVSTDTSTKSRSTAKGIKDFLNASYRDMTQKVDNLGETIQVTDQSGNKVDFTSNPESRRYEIVLVVPDNAPMDVVTEGVNQFKESNPGVNVIVRKGYGNAGESKPAAEAKPENEE